MSAQPGTPKKPVKKPAASLAGLAVKKAPFAAKGAAEPAADEAQAHGTGKPAANEAPAPVAEPPLVAPAAPSIQVPSIPHEVQLEPVRGKSGGATVPINVKISPEHAQRLKVIIGLETAMNMRTVSQQEWCEAILAGAIDEAYNKFKTPANS